MLDLIEFKLTSVLFKSLFDLELERYLFQY